MSIKNFFEEEREQSEVKKMIVTKYFWAWAKVIMPTAKKGSNKIAYIDLFSGPGRYIDGTKSTPLLVLEKAVTDPDMRRMLVTIFNDKDAKNLRSLETEIKLIPGIDSLKYAPYLYNKEVGDEIVKMFEGMKLVPTLFFVDPWGYKGLSLRLVNAVLKDWGCDCIFFFNYNRISMGLNNEFVKEHIDALFGEERAEQLREKLEKLKTRNRELLIVEELVQALKEMGGEYVLPFCFKNSRGRRTSHHLIFVTKHFKGYEIMKEIMAKESSSADQGVPAFKYNPADAHYPTLFELTHPLDDLEKMLMKEFEGEKLTVRKIYELHSIGKNYILKNYKDILRKMEAKGVIQAIPSSDKRRKNKGEVTMPDSIEIIFPHRKDS